MKDDLAARENALLTLDVDRKRLTKTSDELAARELKLRNEQSEFEHSIATVKTTMQRQAEFAARQAAREEELSAREKSMTDKQKLLQQREANIAEKEQALQEIIDANTARMVKLRG